MNSPEPKPLPREGKPRMAGGIFIFLGLLIGTIAGVYFNEASIGMMSGFAIGSAIAIAVWLMDRRKA
ncbi:MAG: hypothetical protein IPH79_02645 [Sphingomonadales bacterium]|nr:hypothetical protein [Sphingomonadales bacterium]